MTSGAGGKRQQIKFIQVIYISKITLIRIFRQDTKKLDGVGPVDNRPFTDKLHHFH